MLRPESDPEEECVCMLNFTSLQATPHPRAGQPAQKTEKQPFEPLRLLIGFRELCNTTRLNQNPETVLHYTTYKRPTTPQKILSAYYQHRWTANHVNSEFFCCCLSLNFPNPSDFPLTVKQLKCWQNMKAAIFHFGCLSSSARLRGGWIKSKTFVLDRTEI